MELKISTLKELDSKQKYRIQLSLNPKSLPTVSHFQCWDRSQSPENTRQAVPSLAKNIVTDTWALVAVAFDSSKV